MVDDWLSLPYKQRKRFTLDLVDAYGMICYICGLPISDPKQLSCQHLVPRSKGGLTTFANCRPAHSSCNSALGNRETVGAAGIIHDGLAEFTRTGGFSDD